jgi:hypothetical protein
MYLFGRSILVAFSFTFLQFVVVVSASTAVSAQTAVAQKSPQISDAAPKNAHWAYRNITIGMKADETRKSLGSPKDKSDEQDLYLFTDDELAQIYYDANHQITAISITYYKDLVPKAPSPREVLGVDASPNPDGSIFKSVRFPKAGYSVSYSKTAGDSPSVSITFQKI